MVDTQLLKGILEGCILSIISQGETYGYEILSKLNAYGFDNLIEATLYPILTRLEKKKMISCRLGKSPLGPSRKYFSITPEGQEYLEEFKQNYSSVIGIANQILFKQENTDNEYTR